MKRARTTRQTHLGQIARIDGLVEACENDPSAKRRQREKARKWRARLERRRNHLLRSLSAHAQICSMTDDYGWPAQIRVIADLGRALGKLDGSETRTGVTP